MNICEFPLEVFISYVFDKLPIKSIVSLGRTCKTMKEYVDIYRGDFDKKYPQANTFWQVDTMETLVNDTEKGLLYVRYKDMGILYVEFLLKKMMVQLKTVLNERSYWVGGEDNLNSIQSSISQFNFAVIEGEKLQKAVLDLFLSILVIVRRNVQGIPMGQSALVEYCQRALAINGQGDELIERRKKFLNNALSEINRSNEQILFCKVMVLSSYMLMDLLKVEKSAFKRYVSVEFREHFNATWDMLTVLDEFLATEKVPGLTLEMINGDMKKAIEG